MLAFRRANLVTVLVGCVFAVSAASVSAKRGAPRPVKPVTAAGVVYSAPVDAMGCVVASDASTQRELWRHRIYAVRVDPSLERDVQDVFITSLQLRGHSLVITNERGERFVLNLSTLKVTREPDRNT